jgi:hypothetical protein
MNLTTDEIRIIEAALNSRVKNAAKTLERVGGEGLEEKWHKDHRLAESTHKKILTELNWREHYGDAIAADHDGRSLNPGGDSWNRGKVAPFES